MVTFSELGLMLISLIWGFVTGTVVGLVFGEKVDAVGFSSADNNRDLNTRLQQRSDFEQ